MKESTRNTMAYLHYCHEGCERHHNVTGIRYLRKNVNRIRLRAYFVHMGGLVRVHQ